MNFDEFKEKYKINLNEQQCEAVKTVEGAILLLAVPGSGKTTVLVTRLGYMIDCIGINPSNILTVTYTVAATKDMRKRYESIFGEESSEKLEFRTINGISYKIIQFYSEKIGKKCFDLEPSETNISKIILNSYLKYVDEYPTESEIKTVRTFITYIKNMMLDENDIKKLSKKANIPIGDIYNDYCAEMRNRNLMDFDDQMVYAYNILCKDTETLQYFQNKYQYICVDEAQDTSKIQHEMISLLSKMHNNLFMVGDEDQSIYGFRAAYPEALMEFERVHENAKILFMEENFRSCGKIIQAATQFIKRNEMRHEKNMITNKPEGDDIREIKLKNRRSQYSYLSKVAENCRIDTAVLYRENESIIPLIDILERKELNYNLKGGDYSFFTHRVVVDIKNIIAFAYNPKDVELFSKIYYKIDTYLKKDMLEKVCTISKERDLNVLDVAASLNSIPANIRKNCKLMQAHLSKMLEENGDKALSRIITNMGYGERVGSTNQQKLETLKMIAVNESSPESFVNRLDELNTIIKNKEPNESKIVFSTIHSSKGLEYDSVFLLDIYDGIFPEKSLSEVESPTEEEKKQLEEERRLFYVAVTRAKRRINIFSTNQKSMFCNELFAREELDPEEEKARAERFKAEANRKRPPKGMLRKTSFAVALESNSKEVSNDSYKSICDRISETMEINHKDFGTGKVTSINGDRISVAFATGEKKMSIKFMIEHGKLV